MNIRICDILIDERPYSRVVYRCARSVSWSIICTPRQGSKAIVVLINDVAFFLVFFLSVFFVKISLLCVTT